MTIGSPTIHKHTHQPTRGSPFVALDRPLSSLLPDSGSRGHGPNRAKILPPRTGILSVSSPNILLIVMDTARASTVLELLDKGELPGLSRFARSGTVFENVFTTSPWTLPSHASLFTGLRSSGHGVHTRSRYFDPPVPTLAERLSIQGYDAVGISGNVWVSPTFGFDAGFDNLSSKWDLFWGGNDLSSVSTASGMERVKEAARTLATKELPLTFLNAVYGKGIQSRTEEKGARITTSRTIRWLRSRDDDRPFFYFINYLEPHLDYRPPKRYADDDPDAVNQDPWEYVTGNTEMATGDFEALRRLYRAEIRYLDSHLERLYTTLSETGLLDETAIFLVGDHGENIGDHDLMDHQYSLNETLLHVPLIARYPPAFSQDVCSNLFEVRDLYPTILELAGVAPETDGSATTLLDEGRDRVFAEYRHPQPRMEALSESVTHLSDTGRSHLDQTLRSVRTLDWKLIEAEDGTTELFPAGNECTDVSDENPAVASALVEEMEGAGIELGRGADRNASVETSESTEERLADLGYI